MIDIIAIMKNKTLPLPLFSRKNALFIINAFLLLCIFIAFHPFIPYCEVTRHSADMQNYSALSVANGSATGLMHMRLTDIFMLYPLAEADSVADVDVLSPDSPSDVAEFSAI